MLNTAPDGEAPDTLTSVEELRAYVERNRISHSGRLGEDDLREVRAVRERLAEAFAAPDTRTAAGLINSLVAEAGTTPQLTDHDGYDWHVHHFAPGASLAQQLAADGGMAMAFVIVSGERDRLRRCAAPDCGRAFVDLSRNRSRRYCDSRTCGNRLHVAAYRARQRESSGDGAPAR
nr:CGNR zinc finger domain-containing protein [Streptomyces sp. HNM0574]